MISKDIENRIIKYFTQSADVEDLDVLNNWLVDDKNQKIFKSYVKTHFSINFAMNNSEFDKVKEKLLKEINKDKKQSSKIRMLSVLKYAAIAIVMLGTGFWVMQNYKDSKSLNVVTPREDAITLELGNGEKQIINEDGSTQIINANGNVVGDKKGNQLIYDRSNKEHELNTLKIPNGRKFEVVLSDGTKVYLNAGSTITYPTVFEKKDPRKVKLEGEAFFEVSHEEKRQFIVSVQDLDVKVYGTKFNVNNYYQDSEVEVVLIEGSVGMSNTDSQSKKNNEVFLKPGYIGIFNKNDKGIINKKVNTDLYTSWMQGELVFRDTPFKKIIETLERHYNIVIINNNEQLAEEKFNATIELNHETIEQVFKYFNKVYQIEYQIIENKIVIN
ncbi:MAG: FecR domain-containing protein [Maribacter dokdonensis]|uniref:FecR family protein n=1 Tax=Maribacter dokdonensis TaxID=320912 RepID=UPI0032674E36